MFVRLGQYAFDLGGYIGPDVDDHLDVAAQASELPKPKELGLPKNFSRRDERLDCP
jgi:hypothetical protein